MKKRKLMWKKLIGICGMMLLTLMPLKTLAAEITTYKTYYEDGTTTPVKYGYDEYSRKILYANGKSLIFQDGKMYEDLAPFGELNDDVDKRIYMSENRDYEELEMLYVQTGGIDDTVYGDYYLTVINTELRGFYVNHVTDANIYIDNSEISNQYIENVDGDVNYTLKNVNEFYGLNMMDTAASMLGKDGGLIKGTLNITLENVNAGNGSILASGTVLGDTSIIIKNSSITSISSVHTVGTASKNANVSVNVTNSELESISIASWGHYGSPATINGDIDVFVKDSNIELGIYRYATNEQGYSSNVVTNTVTGKATVRVEDSVLRDINDRGGYSNEESISENTSVSLKNVEVEDLVSNSVNIEGTVKYVRFTVNNLNFVNNATLISDQQENDGSTFLRKQISGTGTLKANVKETSQLIYFEGENPVAKGTKITIEPVHAEGGNYVPYAKNEKIGRVIEFRFDKNTNATSYLANFVCANYELNELIGRDFSKIAVLDYCEQHNYKLARTSGEGTLIHHASLYDKNADCTHEGVETYYCKNCDKIKYEKTKALGHNYEKSEVVKPTSTEKGYTIYECTRCGDSYKDDYVDVGLKSLEEADVVLPIADFLYNGKAIVPTVMVTFNGTRLTEGKDYTVNFANNISAGTATATVTGIGDYTGTVTRTFTINKAHLDTKTITLSKTSYTYNGKTKKPAVTVKVNGTKLKSGTDYTVTYKNNKNIGKATVTIKGKGNYTGTVTKQFTIKVKKGTKIAVSKNQYEVTGDSAVKFIGTTSTSKTLNIPKTVKYGGKTFKVTAVASKALKSNKKVTKVTVGSYVTTIGSSAFAGCTKLTTVTIGNKVKTIGTSAFEGCKKLSKVTIGSAVTKIDAKAFKNCTGLKSITIPSKVTTYGKQAFYGCKNLKTITFKSKTILAAGKDAFKNIYAKATIKVPKDSYKQYKEMLQATGAGKKIKIVKVK
ncbi:MAG: leucine-rich repeat protein [Agathobacter sp.]|nr:leucine-rich repeat protein [Agathobacter sp.]